MAECGLCQDCKWWGWVYHGETRECLRTQAEHSKAVVISELADDFKNVLHDAVRLQTTGDFGCVQFEAKVP
jgi:hypothetical protein